MSAKHTPGPWYCLPEYSNGGEVHSAAGIICDASIGRNEREEYQKAHRAESEANARLIAAAPELLAALKEILVAAEECGAIGSHGPALKTARAAIAKAQGGAK
jgi:hypothetical protein